MMSSVFRALLAGGICLLWLLRPLGPPGTSAALVVDASTAAVDLARALLEVQVGTDTHVLYRDSIPPSPVVSALLAGEAERVVRDQPGTSPVTLIVPGSAPPLEVRAPSGLVADRRGALDLVVRGTPSEAVDVVLAEGSGLADTLRIVLDEDGVGRTAIGIEASREGAATWSARVGQTVARTSSWVGPAAPVRVLVLTGPPGNESRHLVRALEGAGMTVVVRQDLGREVSVASEGALAPRDPEDLEPFDVVALVGGVTTSEALLLNWVTERGGGLLRIPAATVDADVVDRLSWSGPAEILPLPAVALQARATRVAPPPGAIGLPMATTGGRDGESAVYARADWLGRGRVYTSGLQSWSWVMEAGAGVAHQRHWESVAEWLAGGLTSEATLESRAAVVGLAWTGRIEGSVPSRLALTRPSMSHGASSPPGPRDELTPPLLMVLPDAPGAHTLSDASSDSASPAFGFVATSAEASEAWADAALRVGGAGGAVARRPDGDDRPPTPIGDRAGLRWLLFLLLVGLAGGSWAARRLAGLS